MNNFFKIKFFKIIFCNCLVIAILRIITIPIVILIFLFQYLFTDKGFKNKKVGKND